jgi:hypothetical protein
VSESSFVWLPPFLFYFLCSIFIPRETGNEIHHPQSPIWLKALICWGAARCLEGIIYDIAITTPVPCSPQDDTSHLDLSGPEPCLSSKDVTPLHNKDAKGWILEGCTTLNKTVRFWTSGF